MTKSKNHDNPDQELRIPKSGPRTELLTIIPGTTKQEKFEHIIGIGYDDAKIMKTLAISKDQFNHMKARMDSTIENYLRFQTKTGHLQNLKMALSLEFENAYALKARADAMRKQCEKYPEDRKLAYAEANIRQAFSNVLNSAYTMQRMVPLAQGFSLFIKENSLNAGVKRPGNRLPLLPEDLGV